jgi:GNAT superfamily N-acetyltransferase
MPDMLVKLYRLPALDPALATLAGQGVEVRPATVLDRDIVLAWVKGHFAAWVPEVAAAFCRLPVTCHIAVRDGAVLGFACHDALYRDFFGPMGVSEDARGNGVGRALLLSALHVLRMQGYAYAVIGGVGPVAFYEKTVGALLIPDSQPGPYAGRLR